MNVYTCIYVGTVCMYTCMHVHVCTTWIHIFPNTCQHFTETDQFQEDITTSIYVQYL